MRELRRFSTAVSTSDHAGQLGLVAFGNDGYALTADTDATVRLWHMPASDSSTDTAGHRPAP